MLRLQLSDHAKALRGGRDWGVDEEAAALRVLELNYRHTNGYDDVQDTLYLVECPNLASRFFQDMRSIFTTTVVGMAWLGVTSANWKDEGLER